MVWPTKNPAGGGSGVDLGSDAEAIGERSGPFYVESRKWSAVVDDYLKRINAPPSGVGQQPYINEHDVARAVAAGTKHDADKPDAGTVLAGFWPLVRERLNNDGSIVHLQSVVVPLNVLDRLFDSTVSISKRLTDACVLLPNSSLEQTLRPGTYGARKKYGQDNWLTVADGVNRYYQAAGRHVLRTILGEEKDAEGLVHSECVIWCIWAGATHVLKNEEERLKK